LSRSIEDAQRLDTGVVRPTMHAALIVLSNEQTTDGMVFSEL
jgi:hypothetical protein